MEVKSFRSHLDELLEHLLLGHIAQDYVLRIARQDCKPVRDPAWLLLLLLFKTCFQVLESLRIRELLVSDHFSHKSVTRDDVSLDNLSQTLEIIIVADHKSATDSCTRLFDSLDNIDMHVVVLPEFPGQSDTVLTASRRSVEEVASLQ